jgi:hypothetical protein
MFQFPAFASYPYVFRIRYLVTIPGNRTVACAAAPIFQASKVGCPIRKSTDQRVFAPPRGLSQRITSFIACACQGIHQLPLRHLIVHIANTRRARPTRLATKKDQLLEIRPVPAVKGAISCGRLSVFRDISPMAISEQIFSLRCHAEQASDRDPRQTFFLKRMTDRHPSTFPRGKWWSRTGSNRRPPACKAGALPAELRPLNTSREGWWAWIDSNYRPHPYQGCALTT